MQQDPQRDYRQWLVQADHKSSQSYDKTVLTLAAGALGLSLAFIKDIVHNPNPESLKFLLCGWALLALSLTAILSSMLTSQFALRTAVWQVDNGKISAERPGRRWTIATWCLSVGAGVLFVLGVASLVGFAVANLQSLGK